MLLYKSRAKEQIMNEVQSRLLSLEAVVKELNQLYKHCYTEGELYSLNKPYTIESQDEIKDSIEVNLFSMIIDAVLEGAKPQDKTVYRIINAFKYALNLKEVVGADRYKEFEDRVNLEFNEQVCYN
jgi:hypothetical protein